MVRTLGEYHESILGRGDARDNILSTLGSVQYFRGYHEYNGVFHYLRGFNMKKAFIR